MEPWCWIFRENECARQVEIQIMTYWQQMWEEPHLRDQRCRIAGTQNGNQDDLEIDELTQDIAEQQKQMEGQYQRLKELISVALTEEE